MSISSILTLYDRKCKITSTVFYDTTIRKDTIMAKKQLFGLCPYVTSQKVLTGKWSMYILYILSQEAPIRFNELQRRRMVSLMSARLAQYVSLKGNYTL